MLLYIIFAVLVGHITCQSRIIGGNYALPGQFPYQVTLTLNDSYQCGGSIISETFIVTAAHCLIGHVPSEMKATVGAILLFARDGQSFDIAEFITHPQYVQQTHDYDIALIRLSTALKLGTWAADKIEMVAPKTIMAPHTMAVVSGFGVINAKLKSTDFLKFANVPVWERKYCNAQYHAYITDRMICAGYTNGQESSCPGDSGGPLAADNKLIGVVSWGFGCGSEAPVMYTSVAVVRQWIKEHSGV